MLRGIVGTGISAGKPRSGAPAAVKSIALAKDANSCCCMHMASDAHMHAGLGHWVLGLLLP